MSTTTLNNKVSRKAYLAKAKKAVAHVLGNERQMAAGEFKAKCLRIMDEVQRTGRPLTVTKRGKPVIKVVPIDAGKTKKKDDFFGRLTGVIEIVGDPEDLIRPAFALEEYDMFK